MLANIDVWDVWELSATQWRVAMGGAIGMDYCAVKIVAEASSIELTEDILWKVQQLESWTIERLQQEADNA